MKSYDNVLPDLPKGPLDRYRQKASFNWKSLKFNLEGEDNVVNAVGVSDNPSSLCYEYIFIN